MNFEQNNGRNYLATEEIIVKLDKGDWLEFDVSASTDLRKYAVETAEGLDSNVTLKKSERGFKLSANESIQLLRIHRIL